MPRAIWRTAGPNGFLAGSFKLGMHGDQHGSVAQMVHDGDTINVATALNFAVRFLAIDTPEVSYRAPGSETFVGITNPAIVALLTDPFAAQYAPIAGLSEALRTYVQGRASPNAAQNHATLAEGAHRQLEALIVADMAELQQDKNAFT